MIPTETSAPGDAVSRTPHPDRSLSIKHIRSLCLFPHGNHPPESHRRLPSPDFLFPCCRLASLVRACLSRSEVPRANLNSSPTSFPSLSAFRLTLPSRCFLSRFASIRASLAQAFQAVPFVVSPSHHPPLPAPAEHLKQSSKTRLLLS